MKYEIFGEAFNLTEETLGAFDCFKEGHPNATDVGPHGMVAEANTFHNLTRTMTSFLDVGALFGFYSLLFSMNGGKAFAIEASPWAYPILEAQVTANPDLQITTKQAFVGDTNRLVHCTRDWKHVIGNLDREGEKVDLEETRIDDMELPFIDCMKIDVEAYECQVLRGASKLIKRCKPLIFLEVHCNNLVDNGETHESLMDILKGFGYKVKHYDGTPVRSFRDYSMTRVLCWP